MNFSRGLLAATVLITGAHAFGVDGARADMMSACETEIAASCSDVRRGRGRIASCLFAHANGLSQPCAVEVEKVSNGRMVRRMVPANVRDLEGTQYETELVNACQTDVRRLCSSVPKDGRKQLACLYSREGQVSGNCKSTAQRALSQLR
jgi:hypothetical protein